LEGLALKLFFFVLAAALVLQAVAVWAMRQDPGA